MIRQNSDYKYKFRSIKVGRVSTSHARVYVLLSNDFPNVSQWLNYVALAILFMRVYMTNVEPSSTNYGNLINSMRDEIL